MNWSAGDVPTVPSGVVTVTSTVPVPAGDVAVIDVARVGGDESPGSLPKSTAVAPARSVPVTVTLVPPAGRTGGRGDAGDGTVGAVEAMVVEARGDGAW